MNLTASGVLLRTHLDELDGLGQDVAKEEVAEEEDPRREARHQEENLWSPPSRQAAKQQTRGWGHESDSQSGRGGEWRGEKKGERQN